MKVFTYQEWKRLSLIERREHLAAGGQRPADEPGFLRSLDLQGLQRELTQSHGLVFLSPEEADSIRRRGGPLATCESCGCPLVDCQSYASCVALRGAK